MNSFAVHTYGNSEAVSYTSNEVRVERKNVVVGTAKLFRCIGKSTMNGAFSVVVTKPLTWLSYVVKLT